MGHRRGNFDPRMVTALFTVMVFVAALATLFGIVGLAGIVGGLDRILQGVYDP
jgi:hypothetical protein